MAKRNAATELDLNLLVALDALLTERSVSKAAKRVGITQPSMSHALARLREAFGDPLLVRSGHILLLTPRAEEIVAPLGELMAGVNRLVQGRTAFDPTTATRTFVIAMNDYGTLVVLPSLMAVVARTAPHVDIVVRPLSNDVAAALEQGDADVAIDFFGDLPGGLLRQTLFRERYVCLVRKGHRVANAPLTLERYAKLDHLVVAPRGGHTGLVDAVLAKHGLRRRVAVRVPSFVAAPWLVAESDLILTAPERMAVRAAKVLGLRVLSLPERGPELAAAQVWHDRYHRDPAHEWLRASVVAAARELPPLKR
jgi:DNA-binding transcriptional LysR family regulator